MSFLFIACSGGIDGAKYLDLEPRLSIESYFNGSIKAWGLIQDRRGNVITRFEADMLASWEDGQCILEEKFLYHGTGETQMRTWIIKKSGPLEYEGTAGDIIGIAKGKSFGNAIYWSYEMDVPVSDTTYRLKFDDWMWALPGDVVINRSYLKKFGFKVAELTLFMQKI